MTHRKRIGLFLLLVGLGLVALAGVRWRGDTALRAELSARTTVLEDSARGVHQELIEVSLKNKAVQSSYAEMPDTMRRYGLNKLMDITGGYNKTIRKLEFQERDLKVDIAAVRRRSERERADARARSIPLAVAGVVALMAGVVVALVPARGVAA